MERLEAYCLSPRYPFCLFISHDPEVTRGASTSAPRVDNGDNGGYTRMLVGLITAFKDGIVTNHLHRGDLPANVTFKDSIAVDTETMGLRLERDRLCLVQL